MDTPRLLFISLSADAPLRRVDFLRALSAAVASAALGGCGKADPTGPAGAGAGGGGAGGGGGGSGGGGGLGTPGTPVTPAQRAATITGVEDEVRRLAGGGRRYDPQSLLSYLGQQSAYGSVGYDEAAACAWGIYTDGRIHMIANGAPESTPTTAPRAAAAPAERRTAATAVARLTPTTPPVGASAPARANSDDPLLTEGQFRSVNMWRTLPLESYAHVTEGWVDEDTIPRLSRIAEGLGFDVVERGDVLDDSGFRRPLIADVEGLRDVTGDGVLLLTTYGGYAEVDGVSHSALWTLTPALAQGTPDPTHDQDIDAKRLVYFTAPPSGVPNDPTPLTALGITPEFVRHYGWSFPRGSLVYLNTTGDTLGDWLSPLQAAGARVVIGWEGSPRVRTMLGAAQDFFELLLATNHISSAWPGSLDVEPRLRNYGIEATYAYLYDQGLISGIEVGSGTAQLLKFNASDFVNQLRPTIEWLAINEPAEELLIQGQFGDELGEVFLGSSTTQPPQPELSQVADPALAGSTPLSVSDWAPGFITASLAHAPRSGLVQVRVANRYSNVAHLTRWTVPFQINRTVEGTLLRSVTMEVSFRAFVSGYRLWPDQPLSQQWPLATVMHMSDAQIGWSASGSLSRTRSGVTTTVRWSGAGNFNRNGLGESFFLLGAIRVPQRTLECQLFMSKIDGLEVETSITDAQGTSKSSTTEDFGVATPAATFPSFGPLVLTFDPGWALLAGTMSFTDKNESVLGSNTCETQITWPSVLPQFPPEPDRGGR